MYHSAHKGAGWTGRQYHLGRNKKVFDAELHTLCRALQVFGDREESGRRYTIFSNSAAVIDRITTDRLGPGQRLAMEAIEVCTRLLGRENAVAVRWTPAHLGVESNKLSDLYARGASESIAHAVPPRDQLRAHGESRHGGED